MTKKKEADVPLKRVSANVPPSDAAALEKLAASMGVSVSFLVGRAITQYLRQVLPRVRQFEQLPGSQPLSEDL
jgi:hypothetical protein